MKGFYFVPGTDIEYESAVFSKDAYLLLKERQQHFNNEAPEVAGLLNEQLQALVSKLNILRSFSVVTPDIALAE